MNHTGLVGVSVDEKRWGHARLPRRWGDGNNGSVSFSSQFLTSVRRLLKAARIISDVQIKARSLEHLSHRLFQLHWVKGVAVRGFSRSSKSTYSSNDTTILILASEHPPFARDEINRLVQSVNRRFGTNLSPVLVDRELFDSLQVPQIRQRAHCIWI